MLEILFGFMALLVGFGFMLLPVVRGFYFAVFFVVLLQFSIVLCVLVLSFDLKQLGDLLLEGFAYELVLVTGFKCLFIVVVCAELICLLV